tara:strand:- start:253 stop:651 length:399 start_codon:yes stop_codon:yes gene_type:complete
MFKGDWKCSKCGGAITELPFEPRGTAGLTCRDCYFNDKSGTRSSTPSNDVISGSDIDDRDVPPFDLEESIPASEPTPDDPNNEGEPVKPGERKTFEGDWSCANCGGSITQLPFNPRSSENLKCLDCFKNSKA